MDLLRDAGSIPAASTYDIHRQTVTFEDNPCHRKGFLLRLAALRCLLFPMKSESNAILRWH